MFWKGLAKNHKKTPVQEFLDKVAKKRLWHRCFPVNVAKFSRTPFLHSTSAWLLLFHLYSNFFHLTAWMINLLNASVALIWKPVNWFAAWFLWVSMWGQHWNLEIDEFWILSGQYIPLHGLKNIIIRGPEVYFIYHGIFCKNSQQLLAVHYLL